MATLRTAAAVQAEYDAVRDSLLRAVEAESYSRSDAGMNRSVSRPSIERLRALMVELDKEYRRLTGGGINIRPAAPLDD